MIETLLYLEDIQMIKNVRILALARNEQKAKERFKQHLNRKSLHFIIQDVNIPVQVEEPIHFIIHAASQASPKYYGSDPTGTLKANTIGTCNLLEAAREKQTEAFLYFSSSEVYGNLDTLLENIREDDYGYVDPCAVRSCYAESKRMGENMCVCWAHQYGINAKIVRPFHTFGPGMALDDGRVFADFVKNIIRGENIVLNSTGAAIRAFCYLSDAVIAFFKILLYGEKAHAYNMGNPNNAISIIDLANTLVEMYKNRGIRVIQNIDNANQSYIPSQVITNIPNVNKLLKLNWKPTIILTEGFKRTIEFYES
jgi:nucleoside-diphosphate-sugar epimerase